MYLFQLLTCQDNKPPSSNVKIINKETIWKLSTTHITVDISLGWGKNLPFSEMEVNYPTKKAFPVVTPCFSSFFSGNLSHGAVYGNSLWGGRKCPTEKPSGAF